jgi:hypothetical protein
MKQAKLSKKENEQIVTKGYLDLVLEKKELISKKNLAKIIERNNNFTKEYFEKKAEEKNYVTADCLDEKLDKKIDDKFGRYTGAIMEEFRSQIKMVIEYLQMVIERKDLEHTETEIKIEKHNNWLHGHENRINKLENGFS